MIRNSVAKWTNDAAARIRLFAARNRMQLQTPMNAKWLYLLAIVLAGVWTLGLWGAHALLGLSDEALRAGSSLFAVDPELPQRMTSLVEVAQQSAGVLLLIVWVLGLLLLVIGSWLLRRLIQNFNEVANTGDSHGI